jgi:uncharacterized protein (TIGR03437 family)
MAVRWCLIILPLVLAPAGAQTSSFTPSFQLSALPTPCTNGTFASTLMTGDSTVLTGDFNGDHKPDLAIVCTSSYKAPTPSAEISVLLGNGDGTFQTPLVTSLTGLAFEQVSQGPSPFSLGNILALDLNGDGRTDILFNGFGPAITLKYYSGPSSNLIALFAAPDGTLGPPTTLATGVTYFAEAVADVNGDGIPDVLFDGGGILGFRVAPAVMLGKSGGGFSAPTPLPTPAGYSDPLIALAADFNGDGKPDIVISYREPAANLSSNGQLQVWILLNQGGGSFGPPVAVMNEATSLSSPQFLAGDFTGDGKLDLAAAIDQTVGQDANVTNLYVALGNGDSTFQPVQTTPNIYGGLVSLDLNGDGKLDLAGAGGNFVDFYFSNGDGTFRVLPIDVGATFDPSVVADFNGDGKPDMADTASVAINTTVIAATTGALNGASFASSEPLAPGSLVSIFGSDFATSNAEAGVIPLPPTLGGVSVTIGGTPAPLLFVSAGQINVQVPWEVLGSTADIVVTTAQGTALAPFSAPIGTVSPGIFTTQSGKGQAIAINPDGSLAGPTGSIAGLAVHPAKVGDALIILATGIGAVSPSIPDGAAGGDTLRYTSATPAVTIGGATAPLAFSGLSPQFVGVNQLNVTVPKVAAGVVALQISMGAIVTSNQVTIAVQEP